MIAGPDDFASLIWPMPDALGRAASGLVLRPMPMRPRTIALLGRVGILARFARTAMPTRLGVTARLMTAGLVAMRLCAVTMPVGAARLFLLLALFLGQFGQ